MRLSGSHSRQASVASEGRLASLVAHTDGSRTVVSPREDGPARAVGRQARNKARFQRIRRPARFLRCGLRLQRPTRTFRQVGDRARGGGVTHSREQEVTP